LPKADSGSPYQDVTMKCALIHMLGALALTASAWDDIIKSFALTNAPKKAAPAYGDDVADFHQQVPSISPMITSMQARNWTV
jgi:hypothetical protein